MSSTRTAGDETRDVVIGVKAQAPTFEQYHPPALGVNESRPRISWKLISVDPSVNFVWKQTGYDMQFDDKVHSVVDSKESVLVPWPGRPLVSRQAVAVRVRVHGIVDDESHISSNWSEWATVEAGLMNVEDWHSFMITSKSRFVADDGSLRPVRARKAFDVLSNPIDRARLYITSYGVYEARLNGVRIGDHHMSPGWTSYHHRLHYQVFDVKHLLTAGKGNVLAIEIGAGWYASALGWLGGRRCTYGDKIGLLAQLEIYTDAGVQIISSDATWKSNSSPTIHSEIYNGETYDARVEDSIDGWDGSHQFDDAPWEFVEIIKFPSARLCTATAPPVRVTQTVAAIRIMKSKSGKTIIDFGQNLVGRTRIVSMRVPAGRVVILQHAEVLEDDELGTRPLRTAANRDIITVSDHHIRNWSPKFTFHGFRYVQIDGWTEEDDQPLSLESIVADVLHTDMKRLGYFECSNPVLNQLHQNTVWSMRGNFLSLPTDCPQRDERLGWTGDIAVFAPSASFLYDVTGMLGNWSEDLAAEQAEPDRHGIPPLVIPSVIEKRHPNDRDHWWPRAPQAIWGDSTILVPWSLYQASGDIDILRRQYESMRVWLEIGVKRGADGLWDEDIWQLGDWLDPNAPPQDPGDGRTDGTLVADAFLVHVSAIFADIATILSVPTASSLHAQVQKVRESFQTKYFSASGLMVGDSQTALALAIRFHLWPSDSMKQSVVALRLARLVKKAQFRIATGFAGTPHILHALASSGLAACEGVQLAYRVLLNKSSPSWLYPIMMGATTIWERWDSMLPDGTINSGEMTSFNHYALGSCVDWMHEYIGGLSQLEPGWRQFKVQPIPGGNVTSADIRFESPYGQICCSWNLSRSLFRMKLQVPLSCEALVFLPDKDNGVSPFGQTSHLGEEKVGGIRVSSGVHYFKCSLELGSWPPQAILPPFWDQTQPEHA